MRLPVRVVLPAAGLAALVALGMPAGADPVCTGTEEDAKICVDPGALPGVSNEPGPPVSRCVYVPGDPTCHTVNVPVPVTVDPGRPRDVVTCTGPCATPATDAAGTLLKRVDGVREDAVEEHRACYTGVTVRRALAYAECMVRITGEDL